ncbi:MAG TPA: DinB family protein [Thermoanaerobaculia bacterium]|nr:DinB family protein [Thermoanaerobaculia bacterium]
MELIDYFDRIRERTLKGVARIPPDRIDWTYQDGKFTFGDLIRHLAAIERWMFAENAMLRPSRYPGHGRELADGYDAAVAYMKQMHDEAMPLFRAADLDARCVTPAGIELSVGKWIRAMIEHEIHHRGQLYMYLSMVGVEPPPIFGLKEEEVKARSISS